MSARGDARKLVRQVEALPGWSVTRARRTQHYQFRRGGVIVAVMPGSPSDWRTLRNARADIRRAGGAV